MKTKNIIQRNLPLDRKYSIKTVGYIPILEGGCTCENCGRPIANFATVTDNEKFFTIGLDCLETILFNNDLLDSNSKEKFISDYKPAFEKAKALRIKIVNGQNKDATFTAELYMCNDKKRFGFTFKHLKTISDKSYMVNLGFDFSFNIECFDLTMKYIKDLPNITAYTG